jgi:hypothetical protein
MNTTLPQPFGPKYQERTANGSHGDECVVCGRRTSGRKTSPNLIRVVDGGGRFARLDELQGIDVDAAGDMYIFPIGSECKKALPAGYVQKQ